MSWRKHFLLLLIPLGLLVAGWVQAAKISDVRGTLHNLSSSTTYVRNGVTQNVPARNIKADTETEICIFCHTPHGNQSAATPLWNRDISGATYSANNTYNSSSIDADSSELSAGPGGSSKLCLSCHDGTMAIDKVSVNIDVANKVSSNNTTIAMVNGSGTALTSPVNMPTGAGRDSGFTRNLGTNLSNDHPISFTYSSTLISRDGELNTPAATDTAGGIVMNRAGGKVRPVLPLENGKVQCATCHDPHLRDDSDANAKFLRQNRYQTGAPSAAGYQKDTDIICLACHNKDQNQKGSWAFSAHAHNQVATYAYQSTLPNGVVGTNDIRKFAGKKVWEVACLNCHDTHTVQGSRRLLREGTITALGANDIYQTGISAGSTSANDYSKSGIENTCYQCHDGSARVINATGNASGVPNIQAEFDRGIKMPVTKAGEDALHDINSKVVEDVLVTTLDCATGTAPENKKCGADFIESRANLFTRHAECTDCHNPHRVIKSQSGLPGPLSAANTKAKAGTHQHEDATGYTHTNIISGVLRGAWGVEPDYQNNPSFQYKPTKFVVKRGDPGDSSDTAVTAGHVTREYQICFKCHSNYGYGDDNTYPNDPKRPALGGTGTAANANGHANFSTYTNQAKEFQAPSNHAIQIGSQSLGYNGGAGTSAAVTATNNNNHRSWHPVMAATGRTSRPANGFRTPWSNALGSQTMYCSDCHGSATNTPTASGSAMPFGNTNTDENGNPWGPHGSSINFLLKGDYSTSTGEGQETTGLCFKCHKYSNYATDTSVGGNGSTGFNTNDSDGDGHALHSKRISGKPIRCNWCHVAVPHGWKNRGLLVNLNDVGLEDGKTPAGSVAYPNNTGYTDGPYYRKAFLRIKSFPSGSNWTVGNCMGGTKDSMSTACGSPT
jgi:hypothetical protein